MMKPINKADLDVLLAQLYFIDDLIYATMKPIIEAYGWSSPPGKLAEKFILTYGRTKNFGRIYFAMEDYYGCAIDQRTRTTKVQVSTQGGLSHQLSKNTHFLIGSNLYLARNEMLRLGADVSSKIGKTKRLPKTIFAVISKINALRCELDDRYIKEYGPDEFRKSISPYYPKKDE